MKGKKKLFLLQKKKRFLLHPKIKIIYVIDPTKEADHLLWGTESEVRPPIDRYIIFIQWQCTAKMQGLLIHSLYKSEHQFKTVHIFLNGSGSLKIFPHSLFPSRLWVYIPWKLFGPPTVQKNLVNLQYIVPINNMHHLKAPYIQFIKTILSFT